MRNFVLIVLLLAAGVCAQAPDQKRGTVDGKSVNQAQLETLMNLIPDERARGTIAGNPDELLRYYGFVSRMAEMAEKAKLADQSPYKEQLEVGRKAVMAAAMMAEYTKMHEVAPGEVEKYFQEHKDDFTTANITVVQLPIKTQADTEGTRTLAANLLQQVAGGMDFGALAKQYPVDGDFKSIKKSDTSIPPDVKDMVLALKPGEITRPIVRANAVFLIRLDSLTVKTLQDARGDVLKTLQDSRFQAWMNGVRASVVIGK